ncbi:MAG TPA: sugar-binding protein, partial [Bacteroidales bacterium]
TENSGLTTDYKVTFNCATGEYDFYLTSGPISMIGAFNNWNGDLPMNRDQANPDMWKLTASWPADYEVKFRENADWSNNWGAATFPSGTGTPNGANIPLVAGTYDITFDYSTFAYNFVENTTVCGEIGMVGDFNSWGDDGTEVPSDVYLIRDAMYPNLFSLEYNFTSSTNMYFRANAAQLLPDSPDVWGGTFPCGTGVHDLTKQIAVPGGKYQITFDCNSGDFCFVRLGNSVNAPEVFAITVDGNLDDPDWQINQPISQVIEGSPSEGGLNTATFGVAYNSEYLYIGITVVDNIPSLGDFGELFIDGDKSGGAYDDFDLELKFSGAGLEVVHGPQVILASLQFAFVPSATGYVAEVAIPWEPLGVVPESGNQIGFDIILGDDDTGTGVDYLIAWNGSLSNYENTSAFGDLLFGTLSCGEISLYNETTGDVMLRNSPALPSTTYIATYDLMNNFDMVFRKDLSNSVTWGNAAFPNGVATLGGASIPATTGLYRVQFDCLSGEYSFTTPELPASPDGTAMAQFTETAPNIDGDLSEYNLMYGASISAEGTNPNNTVTWGALWDANGFYVGVHVVDASLVALEPGSPWQNDGIEMYVDGNNSKDGPVEAAWDTQLIRDVTSDPTTAMWHKADGVPVTNDSAIWVVVSGGYNVEYFFGWDNIKFNPGKGRTIGWSLSNNDVDAPNTARTNQTTWYGDANNWSDTKVLGNLQLAGGPFFVDGIQDNHVLYNSYVSIYPNPSNSYVNLVTSEDVFNGNVTIMVMDITGRTIMQQAEAIHGSGQVVRINVANMSRGIYFVNVIGQDGKRAVKKLIVQ